MGTFCFKWLFLLAAFDQETVSQRAAQMYKLRCSDRFFFSMKSSPCWCGGMDGSSPASRNHSWERDFLSHPPLTKFGWCPHPVQLYINQPSKCEHLFVFICINLKVFRSPLNWSAFAFFFCLQSNFVQTSQPHYMALCETKSWMKVTVMCVKALSLSIKGTLPW